jgi:hypothetical protein
VSIAAAIGQHDPHWRDRVAFARRLYEVGWQSNNRAHFRGFLALAIFPVLLSMSAQARSPRSPFSFTSATLSSSPIIDLTG